MTHRNDPMSDALTLVVRTRGKRGFCLQDLVRPAAYHGATVGELAEWMAQSRARGVIEAVAADPADRAPGRRYRICGSDYPDPGTARVRRSSTPPSVPLSPPEPQ